MKKYPSISFNDNKYIGDEIWAFDKLDGSNIRCEWNKKREWYKFGTKNQLIDEKNDQFGDAVTLFMNKYSEGLNKLFTDDKIYRNVLSFVVFVEYFGDCTFAGYHIEEEDNKDVVLFDVNMYKKGWVKPNAFIKDFSHLGIPELVYQGKYTKEFINDVRNGKYELKEGVVTKGLRKTKNNELVWMTKIKENSWLKKLEDKFGEVALLKEVNGNRNLLI